MTDDEENGAPPPPSPDSTEPQPPDNEDYDRRAREAMERGEDPTPIIQEHVMKVLDWLRAKHGTE